MDVKRFDNRTISRELLYLKANYFPWRIPIARVKIYFFPRGPNLAQKPAYLVYVDQVIASVLGQLISLVSSKFSVAS